MTQMLRETMSVFIVSTRLKSWSSVGPASRREFLHIFTFLKSLICVLVGAAFQELALRMASTSTSAIYEIYCEDADERHNRNHWVLE